MSENIETIQEIPLDAPAEIEQTESIPENADPPKRGRGRPAGSKNKPKEPKPPEEPVRQEPKPKPAQKSKPKRKPPVTYESESSEQEDSPPPSRSRRRTAQSAEVENYDPNAIAAQVLGLLQHQHLTKVAARRNHYAGWFHQM